MPTLENTIEFQASTLNDLLEADAKAVALPSGGEGKYRSWAYISSAAAGLLAILLVVALVTGKGGGDGGATTEAKRYPGKEVHKIVKLAVAPGSDIGVGKDVALYKNGQLVTAPVIVAQIIQPKQGSSTVSSVELAMSAEQRDVVNKAFGTSADKGTVETYVPGDATTPATSPPAATTDTAPPAATTDTAPPATTPPESTTPTSSG
jgi:hypothetical protein